MKEELPNIISKFRGKGTCSLNKNSTSQFKFFLAWLFLFLGITETFAGPRDFMQAQKIAQQKRSISVAISPFFAKGFFSARSCPFSYIRLCPEKTMSCVDSPCPAFAYT